LGLRLYWPEEGVREPGGYRICSLSFGIYLSFGVDLEHTKGPQEEPLCKV